MAVYPLKNIAIGDDTYQIQSGSKSYRVTLQASLTTSSNISSLSIKDILETYASSINWTVSDISCLEDGTTYDPSLVMIDDLDGMKYYHAHYDFYGSGGTHKFGNLINWSPDDEQASTVMFGIDEITEISGLVAVSVDNQTNIVGNMEISNFGGGGGGGSALHTLSIYKNGNEVPFTNLAQSDTVEILDISVSPAQTLDNTALANIIATSPVVVKDDTFYGYVSSYNTAYKELSLIYANSTQMYALTLSHQWNLNWQVTSNKRLATQ